MRMACIWEELRCMMAHRGVWALGNISCLHGGIDGSRCTNTEMGLSLD